MRYAVMNGGKRLRPSLVYAAGRTGDAEEPALDAAAAAVELIHGYSLIHDDLPAMDDDDLRRGKPTCHKVYGDAEAILAGDALQALAFRALAHGDLGCVTAERRLRMIEILTQAAGSRGMVGGQSIDHNSVGKTLTLAELEDMHVHKTGALIRASVLLGALCIPGLDEGAYQTLDRYGQYIGLAFQIQDDILDVTGSTEALGKTAGADEALNKPTYVSLMGLNAARDRARELHDSAVECLERFGDNGDDLRRLAGEIIGRNG
jgi:farnesyl diphosphate synthase